MLHGYIFITHGLCFVLSAYEYLIQITADVKLAAAAYLGQTLHCLLCLIGKHISLYSHLGNQLKNQAVLQGQQAVQKVLLINLLVSVFICQLLTVLNCFH